MIWYINFVKNSNYNYTAKSEYLIITYQTKNQLPIYKILQHLLLILQHTSNFCRKLLSEKE